MRAAVTSCQTRCLLFCVVVAAVLVGPLSASGEKLDLTEYLMPQPFPGDFKEFAFNNETGRVIEVLSVLPWKKRGWQAAISQEEVGIATAALTQFVVPGKKALLGEVAAGDLAIRFKKPKRFFKLRTNSGKLNRFKMKGPAFVAGAFVGPGTYRGTWQFVGFEDVTTPAATWPMAGRVQIAASIKIKVRSNGNVVVGVLDRVAWYAEGIGEVASEEGALRVFVNGVLESESMARTGWLESGMWRGTPIP